MQVNPCLFEEPVSREFTSHEALCKRVGDCGGFLHDGFEVPCAFERWSRRWGEGGFEDTFNVECGATELSPGKAHCDARGRGIVETIRSEYRRTDIVMEIFWSDGDVYGIWNAESNARVLRRSLLLLRLCLGW